ncbi:MAG TPA: TauD/TfdA family dioxygenase [Pyrinomonadaceae bacterium]|jgi:alpha-ketoglutarate-dependent taurine dioxygenase|nr:TauD/TfdA family dioxygenase [Pyrinomonadaceae bacterium]
MAEDVNTIEPASNRFGSARRKAVSVSQERLVNKSFLPAHEGFPLVVQPEVENLNLAVWAANNRQLIEQELLTSGAILFRGFKVETVEKFEDVARAVSPQLLDYRERSSPRTEVGKGIYTSTDYPADQPIHFHNEQSYTKSWPMKLWFYCLKAAEQRGATPIADGRKVLSLIDPEIRERFLRRKVMYVRNYGGGMGLSWQTAFQTDKPSELEDYCRRSAIDFEWMGDNRLRTRQIFDTIVTHPKTNEAVWFEHAAFFHVSAIEPAMREALLAEYKEEDLPSNTYYGDNAPIEDSVLEQIRAAYKQAAVSFTWQEGDLLLIDNMLTSHGRESFVGQRKIVVAMAELWPTRDKQ